jgi:hypothetical protein
MLSHESILRAMLPNIIEDKIMKPFAQLSDQQRAMYVEIAKIINYYRSESLDEEAIDEVLLQLSHNED